MWNRNLEKRSVRAFVEYFDEFDEGPLKYSGTFMTSAPDMYRERTGGRSSVKV